LSLSGRRRRGNLVIFGKRGVKTAMATRMTLGVLSNRMVGTLLSQDGSNTTNLAGRG